MKIVNGILSVLLALTSVYLMFINAKTDLDFVCGFTVLVASMLFMCFMMMNEKDEEIERLKSHILRSKGIK